ncbi:MAG: hypothetical protein R2734_15550 [Nocardioides sp.]
MPPADGSRRPPEQASGSSSGTRYEWILADLATCCAATTTVYPSTNEEDTVYIPRRPGVSGRSSRGRLPDRPVDGASWEPRAVERLHLDGTADDWRSAKLTSVRSVTPTSPTT